jgi:hypothetical protein
MVVDAGAGRVAVEEDGLRVVDADESVRRLMEEGLAVFVLASLVLASMKRQELSLTSSDITCGSNSPVLKPGLFRLPSTYWYGMQGYPNAARATRWPPG